MPPVLAEGDRVLLKTKEKELYIGKISNMVQKYVQLYEITRLDFTASLNDSKEIPIDGTLIFYKSDVDEITKIIPKASATPKSNETSGKGLDPQEAKRLKDMSRGFIFIDKRDEAFHKACNYLKECRTLAIAGIALKNWKKLSLLVVSDFIQVYILDVLKLETIDHLKAILENKEVVKVVHDGKMLYRCLDDVYNIRLSPLLDTQISDFMIKGEVDKDSARLMDLDECLDCYDIVPKVALSSALENTKDHELWKTRPLNKFAKEEAALLVTYLITLYNHLIDGLMAEHLEFMKTEYAPLRNLILSPAKTETQNNCSILH